MTATLVSAVAETDAKLVATRRGDRLVCTFRTINGEDAEIWKMPEDEAFAAIRRNQSVKLVRDSRGWNFLDPATVEEPAPGDVLPPDQKRAIAGYIETLADMYAFTHKAVCSRLPDADPVVVGEASRELFRAAIAKFQP